MQIIIVNKVIIGAMALFVMLGFNSLWFNNDNINAKIYNYNNGKFYGELTVKDKRLPLIVNVNADANNGSNSNEKTYNDNKNYNENKQYNEQKDHNISNNINKKEEIINKDDINKRENINKKEEKFNENIKITDDYTPGSIDMIIEKLSQEKFEKLHEDLIKNNFKCMQSNDSKIIYRTYYSNFYVLTKELSFLHKNHTFRKIVLFF